MSRARRALSWTCALAGLALVGHGLYLPAKALLAQVLLERAWERVREGDDDARPWSWADATPIARLHAPRLGVDVIALSDASGRTLAFGPGHIPGTPLPGEDGNVAFAGHRDTHFAFLEQLAPGDVLALETSRGVRRYVVEASAVVDRGDVWVLSGTGQDQLTLVTCWPFDAVVPGGPERYVVRARALDEPTRSVRHDEGRRASVRERQLVAAKAP